MIGVDFCSGVDESTSLDLHPSMRCSFHCRNEMIASFTFHSCAIMITTPPKKTCPPLQLFAGWIVSVVLILLQLVVSYFPPKFTEFFEGDLALSYSVHDTVPYNSFSAAFYPLAMLASFSTATLYPLFCCAYL